MVRDQQGHPRFAIAMLENITERKQTEAALGDEPAAGRLGSELEERRREIALLSEMGDLLAPPQRRGDDGVVEPMAPAVPRGIGLDQRDRRRQRPGGDRGGVGTGPLDVDLLDRRLLALRRAGRTPSITASAAWSASTPASSGRRPASACRCWRRASCSACCTSRSARTGDRSIRGSAS
jgi:hypothetical protein